MFVHFDGDLLVYRCGFAAEKNRWYLEVDGNVREYQYKREALDALDELVPGQYSRVEGEDYRLWSERYLEPVENALHNVRSVINGTIEKLEANEEDVRVYLSGPTNFREGIAKTRIYKGNRDPDHKPQHGEAIREFMARHWDVAVSDGEEADDLIGYEHYRMWLHDEYSSVIASVDKDLDMIPGLHYNFVKEEAYTISPEEAEYNFCFQLLMGDSTDNIPGLPKVGRQKAHDILENVQPEEWFEQVVREYASRAPDPWWEYLLEQGRLLWIRRNPNELWTPDEKWKELGVWGCTADQLSDMQQLRIDNAGP